MANTKDQIRELLGTGLSVEVVSSAIGCTPSYISQLMSEEDFANDVASLRSAALQSATVRDKNIDEIEDKLIARLGSLVDENHYFLRPRELLNAFRVINSSKRRGVAAQQGAITSQTVITLTIPQKVVNKFIMSPKGEVLGIGDQTLVTMPTGELLKKLREGDIVGGSDGSKYTEAAKFLQAPSTGNRAVIIEASAEG